MYPSLHEDVLNILSDAIVPAPWFSEDGNEHDATDEYPTNIMGRFSCYNRRCSKKVWGSKKVAIVIRRYPDNGYNAVVYKQRCKECNKLGVLRLDENSYIERVAYRLKKWAGVPMERPDYTPRQLGPEHESHLCEGCKQGYCQSGVSFDWC